MLKAREKFTEAMALCNEEGWSVIKGNSNVANYEYR